MRRRFATLCAVAATLSFDSSAQTVEKNTAILPLEATEAIEQTPCPRAAGISVEACLLWLTPDRRGADANALARAIERGETGDIGGILQHNAEPAPVEEDESRRPERPERGGQMD